MPEGLISLNHQTLVGTGPTDTSVHCAILIYTFEQLLKFLFICQVSLHAKFISSADRTCMDVHSFCSSDEVTVLLQQQLSTFEKCGLLG